MATASQTQTRKAPRFEFACLKGTNKSDLKLGSTGPDVHQLQAFLRSAGYLGRDCDPGTFCESTAASLKHFQKCYGLTSSGEGDEKTLRLIQQPRCGNPDIVPQSNSSGPAPFVLSGCKYPTNNLTYAFVNSTPDLTVARQREIIRAAFAAWAAVSPLTFQEVAPTASPNFPIAFHRGSHGDGSSFDEGGSLQGNVLAHAFFPPPCGGTFAGSLHFDEFEQWTDAAAPNAIRLLNVAIHEIGHLLGLNHSNTQNAIMFAFYADNVDSLRQDDINGIQAIYGTPGVGPAPIRGTLSGTGIGQTHRVSAQPGRMTVILDGPAGTDFDLYLRAGIAPTRTLFDARGFSGSSHEEVSLNVSGGDVFVMVDSWQGSGNYEVKVTFS
jgi:peptidoglycan hydrolase-like protein with peptidoglycan-binding domain